MDDQHEPEVTDGTEHDHKHHLKQNQRNSKILTATPLTLKCYKYFQHSGNKSFNKSVSKYYNLYST